MQWSRSAERQLDQLVDSVPIDEATALKKAAVQEAEAEAVVTGKPRVNADLALLGFIRSVPPQVQSNVKEALEDKGIDYSKYQDEFSV